MLSAFTLFENFLETKA